MSVVIDQTNAYIQIKYSMKNCANVNAQRYLHVLVDRSLIHKHVNASVQSPDHGVLTIRNSMTSHASVSAQIDQKDAPTVRFLTMIHANAAVLESFDALVGRGLIQIYASVSVLNQSLHVLMLKTLITLRASASAQIDQRDAPTHRYLIIILANVAALISSDALVDKSLIQIRVNANALNQDHGVLMLRNLMM